MNQACAHIIDDDEAIRDALQWLFKTRAVACRTWDSGPQDSRGHLCLYPLLIPSHMNDIASSIKTGARNVTSK